ncbi:hypothetical protein PRUB_a1071 [Pseudoalteromonas rubra]|uniref:Uncharacterized protein n=1 Tax=Pseudoalteromonas rubra TaxID=43658 RepID=A0A8T0C7W8_9GAMM|nr:hypothetical protein PRUB_a1071 [Pseudoalteromonas rubra]
MFILKLQNKTTESFIFLVVPILVVSIYLVSSRQESLLLVAIDPATYALPYYWLRQYVKRAN